MHCLAERGIQVVRDGSGVAWIHLPGLPPDDEMLPTVMARWCIATPRVTVLSLCGPVEMIEGAPVFQGTVFGRTERADGVRRDGLNEDAWVVGRRDVQITYARDDGVEPWQDYAGPSVLGNRAVRGTLMRARNTVTKLAAHLAPWEEWRAWRAKKDAEAWERASEGRGAGAGRRGPARRCLLTRCARS